MAKEKAKYVQLEPDAFLSDIDYQAMSAEQRGVYCTLIFYLYRNNGKLKYDEKLLSRLCNVNGNFDFQTVLCKFQVRRGFIYHKRVTAELHKSQARINAAVKAAKTRWEKQCEDDANASDEQCQVKGSKVKGSNNSSSNNKGKINFSVKAGKFTNITPDDIQRWSEAYPAVNIELSIKQAAQWLVSNPTKLKKNNRRFLTNWFARTQEKGGNKNGGNNPNGKKNINEQNWDEELIPTS